MRIITVIPIGRGMGKDTLTYFTRDDIANGSLVSMPIRGKASYGLVVGSQSVSDNKSEIKSLSFSMKKIDAVKSKGFLSPTFIDSVKKIADYYATTEGAVLSALVPKVIFDSSKELTYTSLTRPEGIFHETLLLQTDDAERYATYKSLIREEFARGRSVFFCLATTEGLKNSEDVLQKGIEKYTYVLHGGIAKKQLVVAWKKIMTETHPVLVIGTGAFLSLPREDVGTIIVEKESSRAFGGQSRPFLDIRTVARIIAKNSNTRLILGDSLLRVETLYEEKTGSAVPFAPLKFRSLSEADCELVSMYSPQDVKKIEFEIFSNRLKQILSHTRENNEHTFLFCGRKGLSPTTVCSDCGTVVTCTVCGAPVVLYGSRMSAHGDGNMFMCHHCGSRRQADKICVHCGGWRLTTLGVGIETVVKKIKEMDSSRDVLIMDKDHVTTHLRAVALRDTFYNTPGALLVGTELALPYLNQKVENTAVVSLDSFFAIPDFRIHEKIFHILLDVRALTDKVMLVQTRQKQTKIFDYALKGNLVDFYRDEIEERKQVNFPPFTTAIKISLSGDKRTVAEKMKEITTLLAPTEVSVFEAFVGSGTLALAKKEYIMHGVMMIPKGQWVDPILLQKLRSLPLSASVKIDPDTLL